MTRKELVQRVRDGLEADLTERQVADIVERTHARLVIVHNGFLGRDQVRELADAGVTDRMVTLRDAVTRAVPVAVPVEPTPRWTVHQPV